MPSKLELTTQYIRTMYSEGRDFRFDLLSRKIQIREEVWRQRQRQPQPQRQLIERVD